MGLDIRWPIGLMFTLIGALLVLCGVVTGSNAEMYKRSLDIISFLLGRAPPYLRCHHVNVGLAWRQNVARLRRAGFGDQVP